MRDKGYKYRLAFGLFVFAMIMVFTQTVSCYASWTPTDFNTWKQGDQYVTDVGRLPRNYQKVDDSWEIIDTTWESVGDTLFTCRKAVVTADAWPDGVSEFTVALKNKTVKLRQTLDRLVFVDTVTWNYQNIMADIPLSNFTHSGRDLTWNFTGGRFRIRKDFGCAAHQIQFKPALLNAICAIYDTLPPAARNRVALGTVFKYEVEGIDDSVFLNHPKVTWKRLAKFGKKWLDLSRQVLHFPGYDTLTRMVEIECEPCEPETVVVDCPPCPGGVDTIYIDCNDCPESGVDTVQRKFTIPVMQEWKKINGSFYLCEYVMMKHIDTLHTVFPDYSVWHAATVVIGGVNLIDDTWIADDNTCYNYGASDDVLIKNAGGKVYKGLARIKDVSGQLPANAVISACSMIVAVSAVTAGGDVYTYRIFKPWVEGLEVVGAVPDDSGATNLGWDSHAFRTTCQGNYWADAGAFCAKLNGEDNIHGWSTAMTCVDSTADRYSVSEDIVNIAGIGRVAFEISTALAQGWYDGTHAENGVLLVGDTDVNIVMNSIEKTSTPNSEDYRGWKFVYTIAEAAGRRIRLLKETQ